MKARQDRQKGRGICFVTATLGFPLPFVVGMQRKDCCPLSHWKGEARLPGTAHPQNGDGCFRPSILESFRKYFRPHHGRPSFDLYYLFSMNATGLSQSLLRRDGESLLLVVWRHLPMRPGLPCHQRMRPMQALACVPLRIMGGMFNLNHEDCQKDIIPYAASPGIIPSFI